jgi:hypothetical protein
MYGSSYMFRHYIAILRERSFLVPPESCSIEEQSIEYYGGCVVFSDMVRGDLRHNTPIHNILSTAPQLSISQKARVTLPEDGNAMPKHVGTTIHD